VEDLTSPVADAGKLFLLCFLGIHKVSHPVKLSTSIKRWSINLLQIIHSQSDRGGLRLQDNRQAGVVNQTHFNHQTPDQPLRSINLDQTTSSLTVASLGFRTIGRLAKQPLE
jgi:hypothetical protein